MIVETDASDYAIAGILSLRCPDDEIRPVAYYSRTLSAPELNYDTVMIVLFFLLTSLV